MKKINCWEYKKCGRQPGGPKVEELGPCPARLNFSRAGTNGGKAAGRCCWKVAGTFCEDKVQGTRAEKLGDCTLCDFFILVKSEEDTAFEL